MEKELVIFTSSFPYGRGEQFLETEIIFLAKQFKKIIIIPSSNIENKQARFVPVNVLVSKPIMFDSILKNTIYQIFNTSPFIFSFGDIFQGEKKYIIPKAIKCLRIVLRARMYWANKEIKDIFANKDKYLVYFYWGCYHNTFLSFVKNPPTVVNRYHRGDLYTEINKYFVIFFQKRILKKINYPFFISSDGSNYLQNKHSDVVLTKAQISRLGVFSRVANTYHSDGVLKLVSCSNVVPVKRLHLMIEALQKSSINIHWTHIGDGFLMDEISKQIQSLPANIKVDLKGRISNDEVYNIYKNQSFHLFINVSSSEGIPVSIMEALASGIPVYATNVGGVSELVDDKVGQLLDVNISPQTLAKALNDFVELSQADIKTIRQNCINRWEERANAEKLYTEFALFLGSI